MATYKSEVGGGGEEVNVFSGVSVAVITATSVPLFMSNCEMQMEIKTPESLL
jgi:hypothetical protein